MSSTHKHINSSVCACTHTHTHALWRGVGIKDFWYACMLEKPTHNSGKERQEMNKLSSWSQILKNITCLKQKLLIMHYSVLLWYEKICPIDWGSWCRSTKATERHTALLCLTCRYMQVAGRETEGGLLTFPSSIWADRGPLRQQVKRLLGNLSEMGRGGKSVVRDFSNCQ